MSNKKKDKKKFTGKITTTRAIKIFEALGFNTAKNWNAAQLEKKIKNLPDLAEGTKLSPKMQKRVNVIVSALKKGREVTVFNAEDVTTDKAREKDVDDAAKREVKRKGEKKAETAKKEKRADKKVIETEKTKTQAKKAVTAGEKKSGVDKCGRREGTQGYKINTCISKVPKSIENLVKETKLPKARIANHLRDMVKRGYVKKTEKDKYCWVA